MVIQTLELKNYRNYEDLQLLFDRGVNIFYGDNAQGKTNILEAIYMCSVTKSHRGAREKDMIRFGEEEAHIKCLVERNDIKDRIDLHLKHSKPKGIAVNQIPLRKSSELFGTLHTVFFSPEDLNLIKNGPAERRKFLDMELCQLDPLYTSHLINYNKVLQQKNQLLKSMTDHQELKDTLEIWNLQLAKFGCALIERRRLFVEELNEILLKIHAKLTKETEQIKMLYEPNCEAAWLEVRLQESQSKEWKAKTSLIGPHRDDINFLVNGIDIRKFGSQGQQRTAALSLKLAEIELVKRKTGTYPVLLLDDVLSELDRNRQLQLLDSLKGVQTMITCTGLDDFVNHRFPVDKVFHVVEGTVVSEN